MNSIDTAQLSRVFALIIKRLGVDYDGFSNINEWYEILQEHIFRVVHVKISTDLLKQLFEEKRIEQLDNETKVVFALYLNYNSWDDIFQKSSKDSSIGSSFYILILVSLVFFLIVFFLFFFKLSI
ncbi:MAG: hypothetical protein IPO21_08490 [Bacteroidales bacterium]|nr:hypothetical protein [Bacteroidales bacterium]